MEDLKSVLGGTGRFFLFAEHGGVGAWPDGTVRPLLEEQNGEELDRVRRGLKDIVWPEGVWVEEKQLALALHTRGAPRAGVPLAHAAFRNVVHGVDASQRLDILEGKEVLEVRPHGLEKGRVVEWIRQRLADVSPILVAIGDDRTDEDTFRRLGPEDFAIRIGPPGEDTAAAFGLPDPFAVHSFLHGVSAGLTYPRKGGA
jgi:trehalose-phosphatase